MKTLQEILEFVQKIEPLEILDDEFDEEKLTNSFTYLLEQVEDDEDVKFAFWCLRNVVLGHNAVLVTNKRIICGQNKNVKGIVLTQKPLLKFVPLKDIKDIHLIPQRWPLGPIGGKIMFNTGGGIVRYRFLRVRNRLLKKGITEPAQALQEAGLIDLIMNLKLELKDDDQETIVVQSAISAADEIMKYKQLLDVGAITQDEYDAKKKQLLGL